jgi:hypothetical protein
VSNHSLWGAEANRLARGEFDRYGAFGSEGHAGGVEWPRGEWGADAVALQQDGEGYLRSCMAKCEPMQARGPPPNGK